MHLPHNPSSSLHGLKCISLRQFRIAKKYHDYLWLNSHLYLKTANILFIIKTLCTRILIQLIQNERGITKVTEVSVFLLVDENLMEFVKGGNENQYQLCSWSPVPLGDTLQGVWVGFWGGNRDLQGCRTAKNSNALFLEISC